MIKKWRSRIFIALVLVATNCLATAEDCPDCPALAQIRISDSGLSKIIGLATDKNLPQIEKEIIKNGQLKNQNWIPESDCQKILGDENYAISFIKCPFLPEFDPEDGSMSLDRKKRNLIQTKFTDGALKNINLNVIKPVVCKDLKCHIAIEVTKLDVQGKFTVQQTKNGKLIMPNKNIHLSMPENAKPLIYEFDVAIDPQTGRLEDVSRVVNNSNKVQIPAGSLKFKIEEKDFTSAEAKRVAELNEFYQRVRNNIGDYKNKEILADQVRIAKAKRYFEKTRGMKKLSAQQEAQIEAEISKEFPSGELAEAAHAQLPATSDPKIQAEVLGKMPTAFFTLPKMSEYLEQSETHARAKLNGYPDTGSYIIGKSGEYIVQEALDAPELMELVLDNFRDRFDDINDEINNSLKNMPQYIDQLAAVPKINGQLIHDINEIKDRIQELQKKIDDRSYDDKQRAEFREQLKKAIKDYREIDAKISSDENYLKLQTQMLVDKIANSNQVVGMSVYAKNKNCDPQPLPARENGKKANYDIATEISVDGFNHYFRQLQENGDLNFCTKMLENGKCKGQLLNFKSPPVVKFDPTTGLHKVYATTDVGTHGQVMTEFNAQFSQCGSSPCLTLTHPKSSAKSFVLKFVGAGYMTEKSIQQASQSLSKEGLLKVPMANLKAVQTNPETGNINFEWDIK